MGIFRTMHLWRYLTNILDVPSTEQFVTLRFYWAGFHTGFYLGAGGEPGLTKNMV